MRLVPCTPPTEPLDAAPRTALVRDAEPQVEWHGFWSRLSDAYYARRTADDGSTQWFRMDDEIAVLDGDRASSADGSRVLPFRSQAMRRVSLVVAESPNGRQMLVGSTRRAGPGVPQ